jgi:hypothetical protein
MVSLVDLDYSMRGTGYIPNALNSHFNGQHVGAALCVPPENRRNPSRPRRGEHEAPKPSDEADWGPGLHSIRSEPCEITKAPACFASGEHNVGHSYGHEAAATRCRLSSELNSKSKTYRFKKGGNNYATWNDRSWKDGRKHGTTTPQEGT